MTASNSLFAPPPCPALQQGDCRQGAGCRCILPAAALPQLRRRHAAVLRGACGAGAWRRAAAAPQPRPGLAPNGAGCGRGGLRGSPMRQPRAAQPAARVGQPQAVCTPAAAIQQRCKLVQRRWAGHPCSNAGAAAVLQLAAAGTTQPHCTPSAGGCGSWRCARKRLQLVLSPAAAPRLVAHAI